MGTFIGQRVGPKVIELTGDFKALTSDVSRHGSLGGARYIYSEAAVAPALVSPKPRVVA